MREDAEEDGRTGGGRSGYKTKNKNPTRQCGEKDNFNRLSVHQWIRSAIRDSQQPTSPIGFLFLKLPPPPCAVLLVVVIAVVV